MLRYLISAVLCLSLTSCFSGQACTTIFAFITVDLEDAAGNPVTTADIKVQLVRTGEMLESPQDFISLGTYIVLTDNQIDKISREKDTLEVTLTRGASSTEASFEVNKDACHIQKLSGPEKLILN